MHDGGRYEHAPIRQASVSDAEAVADILAEAFADDPVMSWTFSPGKPFQRVFLELARGMYLKSGFGHIAGNEAATLWLPAGETGALPFLNELRIAFSAVKEGGLSSILRAKNVTDILTKAHPSEPHFYLFAVGVRREAQGKGLGGAILKEGLKLADEMGAVAYLENSKPKNTPLYERLGFKPLEPIGLPADAPPLLGMLRNSEKPAT